MGNLAEKKVAEVVSENIKSAHVFKKYGIDFCCGGGISLERACLKNNADLQNLIADLENMDKTVDRAHDYNNWDLVFLVDHIKNIHHTYVLQSLPILIEYADKVAAVHGHHYKEVVEIRNLMHEVNDELLSHLQKEEKILFPYIKMLVALNLKKDAFSGPPFGSISNPISIMQTEHEHAGDAFKRIQQLSNNYTTPADACNTFRALYSLLEEFEKDLHLHIHLENNILFPKAIDLELKHLKNV